MRVSNGTGNGQAFSLLGYKGKRNLILVLILLIVFCLFYVVGPLSQGTLIFSTFTNPISGKNDILFYDDRNTTGLFTTQPTSTYGSQSVNSTINKNNGPSTTGKTLPAVDMANTSQLTDWNNTMLYKIWQQASTKDIPSVFRPVMSSADVVLYAQTLHDFISNITAAKLDYFMYGGTLIGSYRHHGLVPWDDDIDIIIPETQKGQLLALLKRLKPAYEVIAKGPRWKFYSAKASPVKEVNHKWPFLDVCFYGQDKRRVWDADRDYRNKYTYPRNMVFPLVKRPFWNLWLNAPKDTYKFLMHTYDISKCQSARYHHKTEKWANRAKKKKVPTATLR